jgi:sulfite reductase beta subunit-like hemoprotein
MAQTKTGNRADRESLRVVMLAQGCGIDEIAAELPVRWGVALQRRLPARQQAEHCGLGSVVSALGLGGGRRVSRRRAHGFEGCPGVNW